MVALTLYLPCKMHGSHQSNSTTAEEPLVWNAYCLRKTLTGECEVTQVAFVQFFIFALVVFLAFFPLCLFKCLVKFFAWQDGTSHSLHLFGFSPVCFTNVSSNGMTGRMQIHASCICSIFHICIGCIFLQCNSLCIFKGLLKLPAREKTYSHFLAFLQCVFQMNPQITCHNWFGSIYLAFLYNVFSNHFNQCIVKKAVWEHSPLRSFFFFHILALRTTLGILE